MLDRRIIILSRSPETLDGVQEYLSRFGTVVSGISRLEDFSHSIDSADVLLFFADDYPRSDALSALSIAAHKLCIVVTRDIDSLRSFKLPGSATGTLVLLRRPVWGWMLLDALRAESTEDHV